MTVEFVVVENRKFEVTEKNASGLANFFVSPTNTTQQLHLLRFFIAGAQILFYESQIMKLTYSQFFYSCCSECGAKHIHPNT